MSEVLAAEYLTVDSIGMPDFDGWAQRVRNDIESGKIGPEVGGLAAELFNDDEMRALIPPAQPGIVLPQDLLRDAAFERAVSCTDEAGELRTTVIGLHLPTSDVLTGVLFHDTLAGGTVRDAYVVDVTVQAILDRAESADLVVEQRDPPSAKADLVELIASARRTIPQPETATWLDHQLLFNRIIDFIPGETPDGSGDWSPSLDDAGVADLADEFLESTARTDVDASHWWRTQLVGSPEALEHLDAQPLPADEPLDVSRVPAEFQETVHTIATLARASATSLFDTETGTAAARYALHLGEHIPHVLDKGKRESAAAAIISTVASANGEFSTTKKAIGESVGFTGDYGSRAHTFCRQVGLNYSNHWYTALKSPRFLTSRTRQRILDGEL